MFFLLRFGRGGQYAVDASFVFNPFRTVGGERLPPDTGQPIISPVSAGNGYIVGFQAAVLEQPPQHRVKRGFRGTDAVRQLLRDAVAIGIAFFQSGQHAGVHHRRVDR